MSVKTRLGKISGLVWSYLKCGKTKANDDGNLSEDINCLPRESLRPLASQQSPTPVTTKRAVSVFKGNGAPWTDSGTNNFSFDESQTKRSEN